MKTRTRTASFMSAICPSVPTKMAWLSQSWGPIGASKIGADWQLIRNDKALVIEADYMIQADDGALIHVYNKGLIVFSPGGEVYGRTAPVFEAPIGPHDWLNKAIFVGTLGQIAGMKDAVRVRVFRVT